MDNAKLKRSNKTDSLCVCVCFGFEYINIYPNERGDELFISNEGGNNYPRRGLKGYGIMLGRLNILYRRIN